MDTIIDSTVSAVLRNISGLDAAKLGPEYSYHSLPLCVIDAVFSIGVKYINAERAVTCWCQAQDPEWVKLKREDVPRHTISDFLRATDGYDDASLSTKFFGGNRQRTSTRGGILKAGAVVQFAHALNNSGVNDFPDIRNPKTAARARSAVSCVPGQRSGISFDYLMMMAGDDSFVKADRMICRFVAEAASLPIVTTDQARSAIVGASEVLSARYPQMTPRLLDHLVWNYQRGRPVKP